MVRARVIATASARDVDYVYGLDADEVIDFRASRFEEGLDPVDVVIDLVGGDVQSRSLAVLKPGGSLGFRRVQAGRRGSESGAACTRNSFLSM